MTTIKDLAEKMNVTENDVRSFARNVINEMKRTGAAEEFVSTYHSDKEKALELLKVAIVSAAERFAAFSEELKVNPGAKLELCKALLEIFNK